MIERQTYSVDETAKLVGLSRGATYAQVHEGTIPSIRLGRRIVVPKAQLDAMLANSAEASATRGEDAAAA